MHSNHISAVNTLLDLKTQLSVIDGWRRENLNEINFTYHIENSKIQSRIDYIYIQNNLLKYFHNWRIDGIKIKTDHY